MRPSHRLAIASALIAVALLAPAAAYADDSSRGVPLPGLRSDPPSSVAASAAALEMRGGVVSLTLHVAVRPSQGAAILLQMPSFGWLGESETYPDRQFPELRIEVDGSPATLSDTFTARAGTANVTAALRKAGVDPYLIIDTPPFVKLKPDDPNALDLQRLGAIESSEGQWLAKWTVQRTVRTALKAGAHTVKLVYKARPAIALMRGSQLTTPAFASAYCTSGMEIAKGRSFVVRTFAIPVSIDSKPLPGVSIALDSSPEASVSFCAAKDGEKQAKPDARGVVRLVSVGKRDK